MYGVIICMPLAILNLPNKDSVIRNYLHAASILNMPNEGFVGQNCLYAAGNIECAS